jgi:hypothetical protein
MGFARSPIDVTEEALKPRANLIPGKLTGVVLVEKRWWGEAKLVVRLK